MSRRARASGVGGRKKPRRGLWSLIRRVFGTPRGRHVIGAAPAPEMSPAPAIGPAPEVSPAVAPAPIASPAPDVEPGIPVAPGIAASAVQALSPVVPATTGLASIQLIFTDGSVVALPESSVEGRQAQYLARRVLEAGRCS